MAEDAVLENVVEEESTIKEEKKESLIKQQFKTKKGRIRFITRVAMFSALAYVFYSFVKFPLPFFPSFLEVKFHNLFLIIAGLLTGPIGGVLSVIVMIGLKLITLGSSTAYVGELFDLILSLSVVLPSSLFYYFDRTRRGGLIGILISFVLWLVVAVVLNYAFVLPFYIRFFFKDNVEAFVGMVSKTIKGITTENFMTYYLFAACLPFNAIVGFVNIAVDILVYKRISVLLKRIGI